MSIEGSLPTNILAGMMAGILSSSVANPTDVLKVNRPLKMPMISWYNLLLNLINYNSTHLFITDIKLKISQSVMISSLKGCVEHTDFS